jgi:hypothetical protein
MPCVPIRHPAVDHCRAVYATARHFLKFLWAALSFSQIAQSDQNYLFAPSARLGRNPAFSPNAQLDQNSGHGRSPQMGRKLTFSELRNRIKTQDMSGMRTWSPGSPFPIAQCDKNRYLPGMRTWAKPPPSVHRKRLITLKGQGSKQRRARSFVMDISFPNLTP